MANKTLSFVLTGIDQSASTTLSAVGLKGQNTADKVSGAFSKMGGLLGGEFGEIGDKLGEIFSSAGEESTKLGTKVAAAGAAITGVGAILTNMGAADKQAQDQLKQAVDDTGASYSDFSEEIEKTISHEENFAHSAVDTQHALQTLTQATQDPTKALDEMSVVTDLAAAKHESLSDAATQVSKILAGSGSRTLSQYGITMQTTGDKTANAQAALDELGQRLSGQASASMDNWGSKVDEVKVKVEDWAAKIGEKAGPALVALGPALTVAGAAMNMWQTHVENAEAAQQALATTTEASEAQVSGSVEAAAASMTAADAEKVASAQSAADAIAGADGEISAAGAATAVNAQSTADAVIAADAEMEAAGEAATFALGPVGIAAGLAAGAIGLFALANRKSSDDTQINTASVQNLTSALEASAGAIDTTVRASVAKQLVDSGAADDAKALGINLETLTSAALGNSDAQNTVKQATVGATQAYLNAATSTGQLSTSNADAADKANDLTKKLGDQSATFTEAQKKAEEYKAALGDTDTTTQDTTTATQAAAQETQNLTAAMSFATGMANNYSNALNLVSGNALSAGQSEESFKDTVQSLSTSVQQNGRSLDDNTAKGRSNVEAVMSAISAANQHAEAVEKQTGSVDQANTALSQDEAALRKAATAAGLNKDQVDALIKKYGAVPKDVQTTITANANQAFSTLGTLSDKLSYVNGLLNNGDVTDYLNLADKVGFSGSATAADKHNAAGGVIGGQTIDEAGDEMLILPDGTRVLPHGQTMQALRSTSQPRGGDTYINVTLPPMYGMQGSAEIGRALASHLQAYQAVGGKVLVK